MFELPYEPIIGEYQNNVILKYMDNFKAIETKLNELENKKEEPPMFISRAEWEEMQDRLYRLERNQGIVCGKETVGPTVLPFSHIVIPSHQKDKTFPVNQTVQLILDHLNLKLEETPAKAVLVPKDDA